MCDSRRPELFVSVLFPQAECGKLVNVPMGEGLDLARNKKVRYNQIVRNLYEVRMV